MPLTGESVEKSLRKTGGTPFCADAVRCTLDEGLMLPSAALNALRRSGLDALYEARAAVPERKIFAPQLDEDGDPRRETPKLCVRFASAEQFFDDPSIAFYSLPIDALLRHPETISDRAIGEIPILIYPDEEPKTAETLRALKANGLTYVLCENIGAILLAKAAGLVPVGGFGLNVTNSDAVRAYADMGLKALFASFELSAPKIRDLRAGIPLGMIVAGRLPLMQLRACPARTDKGCADCDGHPLLNDRKGATFPIACRERRYSTLYNSVPLYLCDKPLPPIDFYAVYCTAESKEEAAALIRSAAAHAPYPHPYTTGLAFRKLL